MKFNKEKLFEKYKIFDTNQNQGSGWIVFFKQFFPLSQITLDTGMAQIVAMAIHNWIHWFYVPIYVILAFFLIKYYLMMVLNFLIAEFAKKIGIWKYSNEYNSKKEHMAPWNLEVQDTLKEICKKLDINHKFKEL